MFTAVPSILTVMLQSSAIFIQKVAVPAGALNLQDLKMTDQIAVLFLENAYFHYCHNSLKGKGNVFYMAT